ncbi:hypothetical protein [Acinetobacter baumannii]|uniref:hypothetical protein n=2 Tax=Acinetobacter baumannii TaxID=470 RepID=UPI00097D17FF|nr:hypothetical protein [Acinetobacter baumannii]AXX46881.1 hypothetical protein Aba10324_16770 [Acinetobacter baumannii]EJB8457962.1 hypothetical protein [Acinetobacter baumannii]MCG5957355.1 hypothetical protein [Acinetobacter baumannii]MCG6611718.1 hypothetical protein [Acinetobacter baumannii]MCG9258906.1 hypothetical protein [Acinetobacter baumannii]
MENISFDHRLKTIYDNKADKSITGLKEKNRKNNFLKDIREDFGNQTNQNLSTQKNHIQKQKMNFSEIYNFGKTAVNHLSYLNKTENIQSYQNYNSLLTQYTDSSYEIFENRQDNITSKKFTLDQQERKIDVVSKNEDKLMVNHMSKLNASIKQTTFASAIFFKKNILLTNSEAFIRDYDGDHTELLENIKRQLPDNIDRIWLNGKLIWSKT